MYIEEKRTSLKISSLMGDFKDLCKKNQTCCWYFACQGTSMSKLENTNSCIHQLTDGRLSFSATGASSRKILFHNIFATAVLSSFICEKMHILFHPEDSTLNQRSEFFSKCWHKICSTEH